MPTLLSYFDGMRRNHRILAIASAVLPIMFIG
jgi:hypothetical protein